MAPSRLLLVGWCACAAPIHAPRAAPILDAPLALQPLPIATIDGKQTLVDTGATVHGVRVSREGASRVIDARGEPQRAAQLASGPLAIRGPWYGVSGLLVPIVISPQAMLLPGQAVKLELERGRVRLYDDPGEAAALVSRAEVRASACPREGAPLFSVAAKIAGELVHVIVDTGSEKTTLGLRTRAAAHLRTWPNYPAKQRDPSGVHDAWVVKGVPVAIGAAETRVDVVITDDAPACGLDGALGVDVLRACDIVLMRGAAGLTCDARSAVPYEP